MYSTTKNKEYFTQRVKRLAELHFTINKLNIKDEKFLNEVNNVWDELQSYGIVDSDDNLVDEFCPIYLTQCKILRHTHHTQSNPFDWERLIKITTMLFMFCSSFITLYACISFIFDKGLNDSNIFFVSCSFICSCYVLIIHIEKLLKLIDENIVA